LRAKSYYSFGISLHAALQRFHDSEDKGVQTVAEAVASLEENWVSAGYDSPEEAAEALAEGRELVAAYVESPAARDPLATTLFVEKQLRKDMGAFELVGRLDRVDEYPDGRLEIVDYKSGIGYSEEGLLSDVAMNSYQLLLRTKMPNRRVFSTVIMLKTQERVSVEPDEETLREFEEAIVSIGTEILNREYAEIEPKPKPLCVNCDFLDLCLRHPEFAEGYSEIAADEGNKPIAQL
jgi:RecB family exonuclease